MGLPFRPVPLDVLARWVFRSLDSGDTVLGIPKVNLEVPGARLGVVRRRPGCRAAVPGIPAGGRSTGDPPRYALRGGAPWGGHGAHAWPSLRSPCAAAWPQ